MQEISKYLVLALFITCAACNKPLPPDQYLKWVSDQEHGLHREKVIGDISLDVQYEPYEYMLIKQGEYNSGVQKKLSKAKDDLLYFKLKLSANDRKSDIFKYNVSSEQELYQRLYYFSYKFQEDVHLESGGKIIPCKLFHFERSYDLTSERSFLLAFDNKNINEDITLVIEPRELETGPVKIKFDKEDFQSIPQIKI
jgi:hypothetical protein